MAEKLEPGYYSDESGRRRYWDGENWLMPVDSSRQATKISWKVLRPFFIGLVVLAVAGAGFLGYQELTYQQKVQLLEKAHEKRATQLKSFATDSVNACSDSGEGFAPGPKSLVINTIGQENPQGATYAEMVCVLQALDATEGVIERVGATNSLQGLVEATWTARSGDLDVRAEWNYHPNPGMTMTIDFSSPYFSEFVPPARY